MANITGTMVKELRLRTGLGIMECKKALVETSGDIEAAIDIMRKSGYLKAAKKSSLTATEGMVFIKVVNGNGIMIELNSQTDFVAKDANFENFGRVLVNTALDESIADVEILKLRFEEERSALVGKLGENIKLRRLSSIKGKFLSTYLHGRGRIGVIVSTLNASEELSKKIAMHIAASRPQYLTPDNIPLEAIQREYNIQKDIAISSGKLPDIAERIIQGRMKKFRSEITLTGQIFIMDSKKTVGKVLEENSALVTDFICFEVGEGLKKSDNDFASDVAEVSKNF
jgi:elongation factor Ts